MEIKTIAVSYNRKFNLGNFNSVDLSCSLWAQIVAEEDEDSCVQILQDKCREHVRAEYHKAKNGSLPVELFPINVTNDKEDDDDHYLHDRELDEVLNITDK